MKLKIFYPILALLIGALFCISFKAGLFSGWENAAEDLLFSNKPISQDLIIITIDDESIKNLGQWPWPRKIFAEAFLKMNEAPPAVVGLDAVFAEASRAGAEDDSALVSALGRISFPVVFPVEATDLYLSDRMPEAANFVYPLPVFRASNNLSLGHANIITDKDGIVRRFPLAIFGADADGGRKVFDAFAYEVVKKSGRAIANESSLQSVNKIVYAAPPGSIRRVPFWRVLNGEAVGLVKNKIALMGVFTADLHDAKPTPMGKEKDMPGVEIQANIANMLLMGYRLENLSSALSFAWIVIAAFIPALLFLFSKKTRTAIITSIGIGIIYLAAIVVLFQMGVIANLLHITLAWIFSTIILFGYRYFIGEREKNKIKNILSRHVSRQVAREIFKDLDKVRLGGEEKEITVFFSDIRGFTTISEKTTPQKLVEILNKYFTEMSEEVLRFGGVLDKYIGDAIMAFWGAPIEDDEQADKAIKASLAMLEKLKKFNEGQRAAGEPEINIGIGLYTGPAIVGNVGSEKRFNYTAIGDTVNVASRLEGLNKEYKTSIIVGESTKNKARGKYNFKYMAAATVKGRNEPINIYTIEV